MSVNVVEFRFLQADDVRVRDGYGVPDSIAFVLATKATDITGLDGEDEAMLIHR